MMEGWVAVYSLPMGALDLRSGEGSYDPENSPFGQRVRRKMDTHFIATEVHKQAQSPSTFSSHVSLL